MKLARTDPWRRSMPGLTPMIDVVFLLLVFFMLAASFEDRVAIDLQAGGAGDVTGAPRLVDVSPQTLRLNGATVTVEQMIETLGDILADRQGVVVLRPRDGADIQRVLDVMVLLTEAGFADLALIE